MKFLNRFLFEEYRQDPDDLAIYRILYSTYVLFLVCPSGKAVIDLPVAFFNPPLSLAALFTNFPTGPTILFLSFCLTLSTLLLLVGWRTPLVSVTTGVLILAIKSWCYAVGKINHDILTAIIPLTLAYSGWGDCRSVDTQRGVRSSGGGYNAPAVAFLVMVIGVAMFTAGWAKLISGWCDPDTLATYAHLRNNPEISGSNTLFADFMLRWHSRFLWKCLDFTTVILELGFFPAIFFRPAFVLLCSVACVFHLGVELMFNIPFSCNVLAYGALVPYASLPMPHFAWERLPFWKTALFLVGISSVLTVYAPNPLGDVVPLHELVIWIGFFAGVGCIALLGKVRFS